MTPSSAPDSPNCQRIPDQTIVDVVRQVDGFHPEQVILFRSYAIGDPAADSDADWLVIMDTPLHNLQQAAQILRAPDDQFALDLLVRTPAPMSERLELGDFFLQDVVETGKVV